MKGPSERAGAPVASGAGHDDAASAADHAIARAAFVWDAARTTGRNVFVLFRRRFEVEALPERAPFHVFADTRYRLRVNGTFLASGPARFVPSQPHFDSFDLLPYVRVGSNVIEIEVNSYGASSFHTMPDGRPAFVAAGGWGAIDFATPGEWLCRRSSAWDAESPPYSFALPAVEMLDTRRLAREWDEAESEAWAAPVAVEDRSAWGPLKPRPTPPLAFDEQKPEQVLKVAAIEPSETILGMRVFDADSRHVGTRRDRRLLYATFLHSPRAQTVELGLFWGPHFVNGSPLACVDDALLGNRQNARVLLREGWNLLYGEPQMLSEVWGQLIGLPKEAGLEARAQPSFECPDTLLHCGPLTAAKLNSVRAKAPADEGELMTMPLTWRRVPRGRGPGLPAREFAWDRPGAEAKQLTGRIEGLRWDVGSGRTWTVVFDFGGEFVGHLVVEVEAPRGTVMDLANDERLRSDGVLGLYQGSPFTDATDRYVLRGGRQRVEGYHVRAGRYLQVTMRIPPEAPESSVVVLERVTVRRSLTVDTVRGAFDCCDPMFNWIWRTGVETLEASAAEVYIDGPWREQGAYVGDTLIEMHADRALGKDLSAAEYCVRLWALGQRSDGQLQAVIPAWHQRPHEDYTLIWILLLHDLWSWTGHHALVESVWPALERIWASPRWIAAESGLWNTHGMHLFLDWGILPEARHGDENACLNAFRFRALECSGALARAIGREDRAAHFTSEANAVRQAFQERLWREDSGCFAHSRLHDGSLAPELAMHPNILALAFGMASDEQHPHLVRFVVEGMRRNAELRPTGNFLGQVELYFLHFALEALYRESLDAEAENLIRAHYSRVKESGAWTFPEGIFGPKSGIGSLCHGWGAGPLRVFSERTLGVRPKTPGRLDQLLVEPRTATLRRASGRVWVPAGPVDVSWRISGDVLFLQVRAPEGVSVEVAPAGALAGLRWFRS